MGNIFLSFLIETIISSGIFYLLFRMMLKNEINFKFNRIFLLSAVIISFAIPFISFPSNTATENLNSINILSYNNWLPQTAETINNTTIAIDAKPEKFQFLSLLTPLYISVLCLLLIRFINSLIKLKSLAKNNPIQKKEDYNIEISCSDGYEVYGKLRVADKYYFTILRRKRGP